jgi:excisionase family DNA binding protein
MRRTSVYSCVKFIVALEFHAMSASLTTREAAEKLGVTPARVRQLVLAGDLPAEKFGRDLMIKESDLKLVEDRPMGRPPKNTTNGKKGGKK